MPATISVAEFRDLAGRMRRDVGLRAALILALTLCQCVVPAHAVDTVEYLAGGAQNELRYECLKKGDNDACVAIRRLDSQIGEQRRTQRQADIQRRITVEVLCKQGLSAFCLSDNERPR